MTLSPLLSDLLTKLLIPLDCLGLEPFISLSTEVELIYNIVLISAVQQSDSVILVHSFIVFSIMTCHRRVIIVPWPIQ